MNLTDKQWDAIKDLFPIEEFDEPGPKGGRPYRKAREILDGVLWILRTGAPWKDLPRTYPPYQTCHHRFMKWGEDGVLFNALKKLADDLKSEEESISPKHILMVATRGLKKGSCC